MFAVSKVLIFDYLFIHPTVLGGGGGRTGGLSKSASARRKNP